jgi:hypothetical protein
MNETIQSAREAFERAGRGCILTTLHSEPPYTTVNVMAGRLYSLPEATLPLTAISSTAVQERGD